MDATEFKIPPECILPKEPLHVDSDIAGPGVLAAFFVSAVITLLAVVGGYLSQSLDDALMGDLDREVIDWSTSKIRKILRIDQASFGFKQKARKQAVTQFILTLSDQQLVTGLAILISGTLNKDKLSLYELYMLLSLAWFSTTTHLATLDALRVHLNRRRFIRHIRVCGMLAIIVLLFYLNFILPTTTSYMPRNLPLRCWHIRDHDLDDRSSTLASYLGVLTVILFTVWAYSVRIFSLYRNTGTCPDQQVGQCLLPQELSASRKALLRAVHLQAMAGKPRLIRKFLGAGFLLSGSFLWSSLMIWFSLSFGIANLILQRWYLGPPLDDDADYMGFGQITSIFLLLLPFLAAGESYYSYAEDQRRHMHPTTQNVYQAIVPAVGVTIPLNTLTVNAQYAALQDDMMRYLAGDIYNIRNMESSSETKQTIPDMKKAVLVEYEKLKEYEKDVSLCTSLGLFGVYFVLHLLFAVQLNLINVMHSTALNFTTILLIPFIAMVFFFEILSAVYVYLGRRTDKYLLVTGKRCEPLER